MEEDLLCWFENAKYEYEFSHKFKTLSGWHYFYRSKTPRNKISWEIFENEYDGTQISYCILDANDKAIGMPRCINVATDEGIDLFEEKLKELENRIA